MKMKVYSIRDSKAEVFMQPFFCTTRGQAIRSFSDAANDEKSQFHRHAGDFSLFELGEYDDVTGTFANLEQPYNCGLASQFLTTK